MTTKARIIAPLFAAAAVATVIAAAPTASAASTRICSDGGGSTICQSPGNAEVHTEQPRVQPPRIYGAYESPLPFLFN
jgi:3-oxoacyl-[acyl-carrier-protein] synthase III